MRHWGNLFWYRSSFVRGKYYVRQEGLTSSHEIQCINWSLILLRYIVHNAALCPEFLKLLLFSILNLNSTHKCTFFFNRRGSYLVVASTVNQAPVGAHPDNVRESYIFM